MLTGKNNEEKIWNYLISEGLTACGAAGLMGNLYAESGLRPNNLQNSYEGKLGLSDTEYTETVDGGTYTNFRNDRAGYGIAQWTHPTRKAFLLSYAKSAGKSIGDLEMQLAFLVYELALSYPAVLNTLKATDSVRTASDIVLLKFEQPADQSEAVKVKRAGYGQAYYDKYTKKGNGTVMGYTNSSLASYTRISPNRTSNRTHAIDTITIHCIVGQWTAKQGCDYFANASVKASANYIVGKDGSIGLCVEERDRSWCSSNAANDHRAVTIEVASDTAHPYAVTAKAYAALLDLVADICKRNGIKKLLWKGDKALVGQVDKQNMTAHRWFANKSCPGDFLYERHGEIAAEVNRRLGVSAEQTPAAAATPYTVRITAENLRIRKGPGTNNAAVGYINPGLYTITEEAKGAGASMWGRLKSGAGWVALDYCKKI